MENRGFLVHITERLRGRVSPKGIGHMSWPMYPCTHGSGVQEQDRPRLCTRHQAAIVTRRAICCLWWSAEHGPQSINQWVAGHPLLVNDQFLCIRLSSLYQQQTSGGCISGWFETLVYKLPVCPSRPPSPHPHTPGAWQWVIVAVICPTRNRPKGVALGRSYRCPVVIVKWALPGVTDRTTGVPNVPLPVRHWLPLSMYTAIHQSGDRQCSQCHCI